MSSCDSVGQLVRLLRLQLPAHHFHGDQKSVGYETALHMSHSFRHGMVWQGLCKRKRGGGARGAQPPLNCQLIQCSYSLQVAKTRMAQKWLHRSSSEGMQPPWIARCTWHTASDTVWYDRDCANAKAGGCRGGAAPPELSNSFECRSSLQRPGCHLRNGWTGAVGRRGSPPWIALTTLCTTSMQVAAQAPPHFCDP